MEEIYSVFILKDLPHWVLNDFFYLFFLIVNSSIKFFFLKFKFVTKIFFDYHIFLPLIFGIEKVLNVECLLKHFIMSKWKFLKIENWEKNMFFHFLLFHYLFPSNAHTHIIILPFVCTPKKSITADPFSKIGRWSNIIDRNRSWKRTRCFVRWIADFC